VRRRELRGGHRQRDEPDHGWGGGGGGGGGVLLVAGVEDTVWVSDLGERGVLAHQPAPLAARIHPHLHINILQRNPI